MRWLLTAILFNTACAAGSASQGELVEADVIVPREGAKALTARFSMGAGDLDVRGGECELARARMRYDTASSVPKVDYVVDDRGFGELIVREDGRHKGRSADWDVCLTHDLPLGLTVALGAGDSNITLAGMQVRWLDVEIGAGDVEIDLRGSILVESRVSIEGGAGNLELHVPREIGVRVAADKGVGGIDIEIDGMRKDGDALVNDAWGKAERSVDVEIELGVGQIRVATQ